MFSQTSSWMGGAGILYTNPTSTRVGIGTATPNAVLHLYRSIGIPSDPTGGSSVNPYLRMELVPAVGSGVYWDMRIVRNPTDHSLMIMPNGNTTRFVIRQDGKFGINGMPNPATTLMVHGGGIFRDKTEISDPTGNHKVSFFYDGANYRVESQSAGDLLFNYGSGQRVVFQPDVKVAGKLMIGTDAHTDGSEIYTLNVNGKVRAKEVKCYTTWADFVFEPGYKLMPLQEVKTYTQQHKHLPDIPSEKEVFQNGVNLAEMNSKLLQKIEELYLYVFELESRIRTLENQK